MSDISFGKSMRILDIFIHLDEGKIVVKREAADYYGINERSIQRDIDDIRAYLDNRRLYEPQDTRRIVYDRSRKGFVMEGRKDS